MPPQKQTENEFQSGDPWQVTGYLISGVVIYGLVGWLADRWLGTTYLVAVGIVVGAAFGIYLVLRRFGTPVAQKVQESEQDDSMS